jgi:uncharacterized protein with HEPN domain
MVSIQSIENYPGNIKDINIYKANKMVRRAVEREIEIIGEAINRIDKIDSGISISGKRQISNMRNRVIHGYDKIDDEIVWGTILRHLPVLKSEIEILLK